MIVNMNRSSFRIAGTVFVCQLDSLLKIIHVEIFYKLMGHSSFSGL